MTPNCHLAQSLKKWCKRRRVRYKWGGLIILIGSLVYFYLIRFGEEKICQLHLYFNYFTDLYLDYFTTPYFIFVRDTLSYFILLGLHFIICLSHSVVEFSVTEVAILVFFIGRFVVELDQCLKNLPKETSSDTENRATIGEKFRSIAMRMLTAYLRWVHLLTTVNKKSRGEIELVQVCYLINRFDRCAPF